MRAYDVSNWTGAPDAGWDAAFGQADNDAVMFIQAIDPPAGYPPGVTRPQMQWALDNGWIPVPYVWPWFSSGIDDVQRKVDLLEPFAGMVPLLAGDVEDTVSIGPMVGSALRGGPVLPNEHLARLQRQPRPSIVRISAEKLAAMPLEARIEYLLAVYQVLDAFPTTTGQPAANYTGPWYWGPYLGGTDVLSSSGHRLWTAQYDGLDDVRSVALYGGWTIDQVLAKQFQGTTSVGSVGNVDVDVVADGAFGSGPSPAPPSDTAGDDPAWVAKKTRVVQLAGELEAVAYQLEQSADDAAAVVTLADGVRGRATEILAPGDPPPGPDAAWVAKKGAVIEAAGELQTVADQLEQAAADGDTDQVRQLADGVKQRAATILA